MDATATPIEILNIFESLIYIRSTMAGSKLKKKKKKIIIKKAIF